MKVRGLDAPSECRAIENTNPTRYFSPDSVMSITTCAPGHVSRSYLRRMTLNERDCFLCIGRLGY
jgi:hypothetical protein